MTNVEEERDARFRKICRMLKEKDIDFSTYEADTGTKYIYFLNEKRIRFSTHKKKNFRRYWADVNPTIKHSFDKLVFRISYLKKGATHE